ncbi:MAG: hypothetical protein D3909_06260 [Candidatus Electrothrix sp. ATG1]|nr:hypothetical protein [Candidatus Electrothrix sp. ATG1]
MSITHLIIFLVQFFLLVPVLFWFIKKSPKGSKNRKISLIIALAFLCYASVDTYFHRFLIASDFYFVQGDWKKSGDIAEKGFQRLEDKSEFHKFLYGSFSLYRKIKRAERKIEAVDKELKKKSPTPPIPFVQAE